MARRNAARNRRAVKRVEGWAAKTKGLRAYLKANAPAAIQQILRDGIDAISASTRPSWEPRVKDGGSPLQGIEKHMRVVKSAFGAKLSLRGPASWAHKGTNRQVARPIVPDGGLLATEVWPLIRAAIQRLTADYFAQGGT